MQCIILFIGYFLWYSFFNDWRISYTVVNVAFCLLTFFTNSIQFMRARMKTPMKRSTLFEIRSARFSDLTFFQFWKATCHNAWCEKVLQHASIVGEVHNPDPEVITYLWSRNTRFVFIRQTSRHVVNKIHFFLCVGDPQVHPIKSACLQHLIIIAFLSYHDILRSVVFPSRLLYLSHHHAEVQLLRWHATWRLEEKAAATNKILNECKTAWLKATSLSTAQLSWNRWIVKCLRSTGWLGLSKFKQIKVGTAKRLDTCLHRFDEEEEHQGTEERFARAESEVHFHCLK